MYPEEVWYNIKHYDMPLESFKQFLEEYKESLKKEWNILIKDNSLNEEF